jgi:hypothetical protein
VHAVPGPLGDLRRGNHGVEPERHCGVSQVVRPAGERGALLCGREGLFPRLAPGRPVGVLRQWLPGRRAALPAGAAPGLVLDNGWVCT